MQVCGGGPSLSVWHLRSMACTSVLKTASTQQAALFHDDLVSYQSNNCKVAILLILQTAL